MGSLPIGDGIFLQLLLPRLGGLKALWRNSFVIVWLLPEKSTDLDQLYSASTTLSCKGQFLTLWKIKYEFPAAVVKHFDDDVQNVPTPRDST